MLLWCVFWGGVAAILVLLIDSVGRTDDDYEVRSGRTGYADSHLDDD